MKTQTETLRPYGPGKFDLMLDSYVYLLSLEGCDEEHGDSNETGWHGRMNGPFDGEYFEEGPEAHQYPSLTDDEKAFLRKQKGCVIGEDSQGFVFVDYYETEEELESEWQEIERFHETLGTTEKALQLGRQERKALAFAAKHDTWHSYANDVKRPIQSLERKGFVETNAHQQFRATDKGRIYAYHVLL